jgi:DNA-binding IscR family transcriptional regulator
VLARDPSEINLRHIYEAVVVETELLKRPPELDSIPSKLLGRYIDRLFTDAEEALLENLESITVQEMDSKMAPAISKALKSTQRKTIGSH